MSDYKQSLWIITSLSHDDKVRVEIYNHEGDAREDARYNAEDEAGGGAWKAVEVHHETVRVIDGEVVP